MWLFYIFRVELDETEWRNVVIVYNLNGKGRLVEIRQFSPNMEEYPKRTQLGGVPSVHISLYTC